VPRLTTAPPSRRAEPERTRHVVARARADHQPCRETELSDGGCSQGSGRFIRSQHAQQTKRLGAFVPDRQGEQIAPLGLLPW